MTPEEMQKALDDKFAAVQKQLSDAQEAGASKEDLLPLHDAIKTQGEAVDDFIASMQKDQVESVKQQFSSFLTENKSVIENLYKAKSGEIEFIPKLVADVTTGSGTDITTPSAILSTDLNNINLRDDSSLLNLATVSSTGEARFSYTEAVPKEGGYAFIAEGVEKSQIDFKWENRFPVPKKAAAYEILTEESVTDIKRLRAVAEDYLVKKHGLFKANGVYFADGVSENPLGATVLARAFVAGDMVDMFELGTSNFMDVVNAIITDIYSTVAYVDAPSHMPNIVLISPFDFFKNLVGAKDTRGLPLYPQAGLFNEVRIGGVLIRPWIKIPTGKIFVSDMTKYNVINYVPFSIRIGWINDQFITNKFTMLGESRYYQYVKNLDLGAFVYDDISVVKLAITAAT